ncbi:MAG TPA: ATP-binding protein [Longimicrobiales bacterium]|nr:ATP-binding protein [Longimicrobiales bacterium]
MLRRIEAPLTPASRTTLRILPFVAAAVALLLGLLLVDLGRRSSAVAHEADRYHTASEQLGRMLLHMNSVEANQRGYVLTADSVYLSAYHDAVTAVRAEMESLSGQVRTPAEATAFERLAVLVERRIAFSREVIDVRLSRGLGASAALVGEGSGQETMSELTALVGQMTVAMEQVRHDRALGLERRSRALLWIIIMGSLVSAVTAFGSSAVLGRIARRSEEDAVRLRDANAQLRDQASELEAQAMELEQQAQELEETAANAQAHEEWFRALVEHAIDATIVADAQGRITYASRSLSSILGREPETLVGTPLHELIHPQDLRSAMRVLTRARRTPGRAAPGEMRLQHADGGWRTVAGHVSNLLEHRSVNGLVINAHDMTQERSTAEQLRQAQKMEAVGRLAGGIAHDFNNLLTTIQGFTQFALDSLDESHRARGDLQEVLRAADSAGSLTRQILAFSRQQVLRPEVLDLNAVVQESSSMMARLLGTDIVLTTQLERAPWRVRVDRGQMLQVIMNLAVNARDAMPDGGKLVIETRNVTLSDDYADTHHGVSPGDYLVLTISDTGHGIPSDVRDHIFEPFFTTKEKGKGTGLGLSTTHGIVQQSGGHIWVYSEIGRGTSFKIYLPATADSVEQRVAPAVSVPAPGRRRTVLVVEDDAGVRSFAERTLDRHGFTVICTDNAESALAALRDFRDDIAIVVTDVIMPGMSGAELGRQIAALYPRMPVLYTSGYPSGEVVARGNIPPNVDFMEKPYTSTELVERVTSAVT